MKDKKLTTYQMAVTAVMAAVLCVLGPLTVPIGAVPISLANFVICLTAWLLGPKFGTLSVVIYLALGAIGIPVFSGYGAGLTKLAGPTGGYLVGYLLLAFIGGHMLWEVWKGEGEEDENEEAGPLRLGELTLLAIATSIDALAVGITFAFLGVNIVSAISIIGCTTFCLSLVGVAVGNFFGTRYKKRAELSGGIILILLGAKILLEHLGILG